MNPKFMELAKAKQDRIKNAGYKVFAENTYRKASMQAIADNGSISKALLFHYFHNKQEFYEYLFQSAIEELQSNRSIENEVVTDFFVLLEKEIKERFKLMREYPLLYRFIVNVYHQNIFDDIGGIREYINQQTEQKRTMMLMRIDSSKFKDPNDMEIMYDLIYDLASGYYQKVENDLWTQPHLINQGFQLYIDSLRENYYREDLICKKK